MVYFIKRKKRYKMKKTVVPFMCAALFLLTSCADTPESIKSNKHDSDETQSVFVSPDKVYDDFDSAYSTEYTKFTLPDSSAIRHTPPEGIYDLELAYNNKENDIEWKKGKVSELYSALDFSFEAEMTAEEFSASLEQGSEDVTVRGYSKPYVRWKEDETGVSSSSENVTSRDVYFIDHMKPEEIPDELNKASSTALSIWEKVKEAVGDELDVQASDGYIIRTPDDVGYEIELRKSYKGVGILNLFSRFSPLPSYGDENALLSFSMQTYMDFDSNFSPEFLNSCETFTAAKAEPLEKVLSFKGACDILERELADYMSVTFDDVTLMYEPIGTYTDPQGTEEPGNIICTPKWYFIIDEVADIGMHYIYYITVDCVTGDVEVNLP